jgi:hypothetical protein
MKNLIIIISMIFVFLVPLNASAITDETLQKWALETSDSELTDIDDTSQPHASAYAVLRNGNGELVGVSHVIASQYLEHPVLYAYLDEHPLVENVTIEGTQFEMKTIPMTFNISPDQCSNKKGAGQGNIHDACFFYSFSTGLGMSFEVQNQKHSVTGFSGLHHGIIFESGDRINMIWNTLVPTN